MFYDRKIRYIDDMQNGERARGAGFIRAEVRDEQCRMNIHVSGLHATDSFEKPVFLVHGGRESFLCKIKITAGKGNTEEMCLNSRHLGENGISYEEIEEVRIPLAAGRELRCLWNKNVTKAGRAVQRGNNAGNPEEIRPGVSPEERNVTKEEDVSRREENTSQKAKDVSRRKENTPQKVEDVSKKEENTPQKVEDVSKKAENTPQKAEDVSKKAKNIPQKAESVSWEEENTPQKAESVSWEEENTPQKVESVSWEGENTPQKAEDVSWREESTPQKMEEAGLEEIPEENRAVELTEIEEQNEMPGQREARDQIEENGQKEKNHRSEMIQRDEMREQNKITERDNAAEPGGMTEKNEVIAAGQKKIKEYNEESGRKETAERDETAGQAEIMEQSETSRLPVEPSESGDFLHAGEQEQIPEQVRRPVSEKAQKAPAEIAFPLEDKWRQLAAIYPHIAPFKDDRDYLSLGPEDFVIFPNRFYKLINNSFLLHGYHNYKHLILTRMERRGEVRYYIGVPGNYYDKEKQVAVMFGFESFECREEPAQQGEYGYYMMRVEL